MAFDPSAIQHAYEAIADAYDATFADELEANEFDRAIVDSAIAGVPQRGLVLDVGCGPAQVCRRVVALGRTAIGLDLTPAMLAIARRVPTLRLTCGDACALPYRSGVASATVAWYSLHNLPRSLMPAAFSEMRRVLRPGGTALIATHAGQGEKHIEHPHSDGSGTVTITYYEADELIGLAEEHRLAHVDLRERQPLGHERQVRKLYLTTRAI